MIVGAFSAPKGAEEKRQEHRDVRWWVGPNYPIVAFFHQPFARFRVYTYENASFQRVLTTVCIARKMALTLRARNSLHPAVRMLTHLLNDQLPFSRLRLSAQPFAIRAFFTAVLCCLMQFAFGVQLIVCMVGGEVANNGLPIRVGSELTYDDNLELEFSTVDDVVVVVSPERGRYLITARKSKVVDGTVRVLVRENFIPCPILRRGVDAAEPAADIKEILRDGRISMLDSIVLPLGNVKTYPDQYFLVTFNYDDEKITRKISINPSSPYLILSTNLFRIAGEFIDPSEVRNVELYLHNAVQDTTQKISDLKITSLLSESTVQELRVLVNGIRAYTNDNESLLMQEVKSHIEEFYGQIGEVTLQRYLRMMTVR